MRRAVEADDCDARWAQVEDAIEDGDPSELEDCWTRFVDAVTRHLPAGMGPGSEAPREHLRLGAVLGEMARAVEARAFTQLLELGDELYLLHRRLVVG